MKNSTSRSIYISAAHKSSGKTIVSLGLSRILSNLNQDIQTFKKGPDYIDMGWLSLASKKSSYNLDFNTQTKKEINNFYDQKKSTINIIEGNKGLYDGISVSGIDDNAAMSMLLNAPVILVIDTEGITRGIAPLLQGYINFEKKCNIKGVILNKVKTERHENKLINAVKEYTNLEILGSIRKSKDLEISERHLGLIPVNEKKIANKKIEQISRIINDSIDQKKFNKIGINFKKNKLSKKDVKKANFLTNKKKLKLGVFYDKSFGFYYPDDIENFEKYGAEIIQINSIKNKKLPKVDALFIGGGFPETNAPVIKKNKNLMKNVKDFIESGKPCYAECGGLMYLSESINYDNKKHKMVGVIPGNIIMDKKSASMIKYVYNCWLATKVTFFHELYSKLDKTYNYHMIINTLADFQNIGPSHMRVKQLGYDGSCFPKDMEAFANFLDSELLKSVIKVNESLVSSR